MDNNKHVADFPTLPPFLFDWLTLTTHRDPDLGPDATNYFQYEGEIAAIAILFFRLTVRKQTEPRAVSWFFGILLACLAHMKKSYELISAVELFSYAASYFLSAQWPSAVKKPVLVRLAAIAGSAAASLLISHLFLSSSAKGMELVMLLLSPKFVVRGLDHLLPISEMTSAYKIMAAFAHPDVLRKQISHLFFVTFHIQVGMGFIGIDFLLKEQSRRNQLIRLDQGENGEEEKVGNGTSENPKESQIQAKIIRAKRFQRGATSFILFTAMPYMLQIIMYGNINKFAFTCFEHDMHRSVRLNELFEDHNNLAAMAADSAISAESFANSMTSVVTKSYDIFNRKFFSLPKILLLPGIMMRQPMLIVQVFPFIFVSDWVKASIVSYMTKAIENLRKERKVLKAMRTKVESFDIKNAELLQRSGPGASKFTQRRWEELTVKIQSREILGDILGRTKGFFAFMQRNFVFTVLIDYALASLIANGKMAASEIFVFTRAVEDTVDMVLMRSRSEAELAQIETETDKLQDLADLWARQKQKKMFLPCRLPVKGDHRALVLRNLHYSRGTASVRADHVELLPGIYALTGSNGSGKSTLFRVLMSCNTNKASIELPSSINLLTPMEPLAEEDDIFGENCCVPSEEVLPYDSDLDEQNEPCDSASNCGNGTTDIKQMKFQHHPMPKLSIMMPSPHVVEISQNFYWPLYSKPIDWIFQGHGAGRLHLDDGELEGCARTAAEQLYSLGFYQPVQQKEVAGGDKVVEVQVDGTIVAQNSTSDDESIIRHIQRELMLEKEDWFGELSGGQKSKVELVRKVFLQDHCPDVLLVDETMAPLDPASKALVMGKIKEFCRDSVVIVIYHTDVGREVNVEGKSVDCVPSNDFFDNNIHLDKGLLQIRPTC